MVPASNYIVIGQKEAYTPEEIELAKMLFSFYKERRERQGIDYAFWDTVSSAIKDCWLYTAQQFLATEEGRNNVKAMRAGLAKAGLQSKSTESIMDQPV